MPGIMGKSMIDMALHRPRHLFHLETEYTQTKASLAPRENDVRLRNAQILCDQTFPWTASSDSALSLSSTFFCTGIHYSEAI